MSTNDAFCALYEGCFYLFVCLFVLICFNIIYFWERETETETEHQQGRGRERVGHRIWRRLRAPSCLHRAWHRAQTRELWTVRSWPEPNLDAQATEPPRRPWRLFLEVASWWMYIPGAPKPSCYRYNCLTFLSAFNLSSHEKLIGTMKLSWHQFLIRMSIVLLFSTIS